MTDETALSDRMRKLAKKRSDLPDNWAELADAFDIAAAGFYGDPQTVGVREFMGHYARARKAWCAATGESLV